MQEIRKISWSRVVGGVETEAGNFIRNTRFDDNQWSFLRIGVMCALEDAQTTRQAAQFCTL